MVWVCWAVSNIASSSSGLMRWPQLSSLAWWLGVIAVVFRFSKKGWENSSCIAFTLVDQSMIQCLVLRLVETVMLGVMSTWKQKMHSVGRHVLHLQAFWCFIYFAIQLSLALASRDFRGQSSVFSKLRFTYHHNTWAWKFKYIYFLQCILLYLLCWWAAWTFEMPMNVTDGGLPVYLFFQSSLLSKQWISRTVVTFPEVLSSTLYCVVCVLHIGRCQVFEVWINKLVHI